MIIIILMIALYMDDDVDNGHIAHAAIHDWVKTSPTIKQTQQLYNWDNA